jgi:hypothetical protein
MSVAMIKTCEGDLYADSLHTSSIGGENNCGESRRTPGEIARDCPLHGDFEGVTHAAAYALHASLADNPGRRPYG